MSRYRLIAALGTPLTSTESLHVEGMIRHMADVCQAKIDAVLVGGTMGNMQLLTDATYQDLVRCASEYLAGRGELFIGAGDTSFARTRDRIHWLNCFAMDGVALLSPYFAKYTQKELIAYFSALAEESRWPVYLYDLPGKTGTVLEIQTVLELARHPNIAGIKCSGDAGVARSLYEQRPANFRVLIAQPHLLDILMQGGLNEHVDGMYALAPRWASAIRNAIEANQNVRSGEIQMKLSALLVVLQTYGIMPSFSALMNARGIPGRFMPKPAADLSPSARDALLGEPIVRELIAEEEWVFPRVEASEMTRSIGK